MKRLFVPLICIFTMMLCSACYVRSLDTSRKYRYRQPDADTTYEELLASSRDLGDVWDFANLWSIRLGEDSVWDTNFEEDACVRILDELKEIMGSYTLYAFTQPEDIRDYGRYAEDLFDKPSEEYVVWANFSVLVTNQISDEDVYLHNLRIIMTDRDTCYFIVDYGDNVESILDRFVYYTDDATLVDTLYEWAEKYYVEGQRNRDNQ